MKALIEPRTQARMCFERKSSIGKDFLCIKTQYVQTHKSPATVHGKWNLLTPLTILWMRDTHTDKLTQRKTVGDTEQKASVRDGLDTEETETITSIDR